MSMVKVLREHLINDRLPSHLLSSVHPEHTVSTFVDTVCETISSGIFHTTYSCTHQYMAVNSDDWDVQVLTVRVVCHSAGRVTTTSASDNHWSLYFILGDGKSVRFNMRADPGYVDGTLVIRSYNYELSSSSIRHWDYRAIQYFTVSMAYDCLVTRARYHQYNMSGGGSGCRWWIYTVVSTLASAEWIQSDAAMSLWPDLLFKYSTRQSRTSLKMVRGEFY